jgi:hypothetical protein
VYVIPGAFPERRVVDVIGVAVATVAPVAIR